MTIQVGIILINYKDYADKFLSDCINSIRQIAFPSGSYKVYIVDNESTPQTESYLARIAPEADIIIHKENIGFAAGNNTGVEVAVQDGCDFLYILNMDTVVDLNCLEAVWQTYRSFDHVGCVQSRLMLHQAPQTINSLGNLLHFLGFGYSDRYKEKMTGNEVDREITYPSGAALFISVEHFLTLVGFNPEFFMYHEDVELGLKVKLSGLKNIISINSIVYHKYEFGRSIAKFYWMERNRFITWLTTFKLATLIVILPAAIVMELGLILYAILGGWLGKKLKAYAWFLSFTNLKKVWRWRRQMQCMRQVKDKAIVKSFVGRILYQEEVNQPLLQKISNLIFNLYWLVVKKIIFW